MITILENFVIAIVIVVIFEGLIPFPKETFWKRFLVLVIYYWFILGIAGLIKNAVS